jgi:hypothetical protein
VRAKQEYVDCPVALMRVFGQICYPKTLDDSSPFITKVTACEQTAKNKTSGLVIEFSTGGTMGIDATFYGGLVWFLDNQVSIFRREGMAALSMQERVLWQKSQPG